MRCALCDGSQFDVIATKLRFDIPRRVVRCSQCTLASLEDPGADSVDYSAPEYRRHHGPVLGRSSSPREIFEMQLPIDQRRRKRVDHLLNASSEVLEIGCSAGQFLSTIRSDVRRATGIEPEPAEARFAREELGLEVHSASVGRDHLEIGQFDIVFLFHVLEHVSDPVDFLRACTLYLKPGGVIAIEVPNVDDALLTVYSVSEYRDFYFRLPHIFYYSPTTLEGMLEKSGFVGGAETVQMFPFTNHVHWLTSRRPQPTMLEAAALPRWEPGVEWGDASGDLREWFDEVEDGYETLCRRHGVGDCVWYVGHPSNDR